MQPIITIPIHSYFYVDIIVDNFNGLAQLHPNACRDCQILLEAIDDVFHQWSPFFESNQSCLKVLSMRLFLGYHQCSPWVGYLVKWQFNITQTSGCPSFWDPFEYSVYSKKNKHQEVAQSSWLAVLNIPCPSKILKHLQLYTTCPVQNTSCPSLYMPTASHHTRTAKLEVCTPVAEGHNESSELVA